MATVTISVGPGGDPPEAFDDSYITDEDTVLNVPAPGVLDNDFDVDGDPLTAVLDTDVSHGLQTLEVYENGGEALITVEGEEFTVSPGYEFSHQGVDYEVVFVIIQSDGSAYVSINHS